MGAFGGCWPHWSGFRFFDLVMRNSHLHTFTWKLGIKLPKFVIMFVIPYPLSKTWIRFSRYMPCICPSCLSLKPKLKQTFKVWDRYHQPVLFFLPVCISESALTPMSLCLDMSKFLNTWMNTALGSNHIPVSLLSSEANLKPNKGPCRRSAKTAKNLPGKKQSCVVHRGAAMLRLLRFCFCLPLTFSEELDFEQAPLVFMGLWLKSVGGW